MHLIPLNGTLKIISCYLFYHYSKKLGAKVIGFHSSSLLATSWDVEMMAGSGAAFSDSNMGVTCRAWKNSKIKGQWLW